MRLPVDRYHVVLGRLVASRRAVLLAPSMGYLADDVDLAEATTCVVTNAN